ncbi:MAG: NTP transferase domain-containing protein [Myxococcota bacterium]
MSRIGMVLAGGLGKRMKSTKPKVLHEVGGVPMVVRAINALREAPVDRLVAVLSHASDQVSAVLPSDTAVVVQERPRGTASAIIDSAEYLERDDDVIVVSFGDMPWLNPRSVNRLAAAIEDGADAAVLTFVFDDPPHFGRILRDGEGNLVDIVQFKDCSEGQRSIGELDAGMFAFNAKAIRDVLDQLDSNNAQNEIYLTDVPGKIALGGGRVVCVAAERLEEALGVNDPRHLEFAEQLLALRESEEVLHLADDFYRSICEAYQQ